MQYRVVVFPDPFGPMKPVAHPGSTTMSIGPKSKRGKLFLNPISSNADVTDSSEG